MDYFAPAWAQTAAIEKGYSNRPPDPETMYGITIAVARAYGYDGPMKELPYSKAVQIGRAEYWDRLRLSEVANISAPVATELFDTNMNLWEGAAGEFLQRALNAFDITSPIGVLLGDLKVDGIIGSSTIARLSVVMNSRPNREVETILLRVLNSLQCADYVRQANAQPWKRQFFAGWILKRVQIETEHAQGLADVGRVAPRV